MSSTTNPKQTYPSKSNLKTPLSPPTDRGNSQPNYTDSDVIHHVYFEDNDSFFPPSWLGQTNDQSKRKMSEDSAASEDLSYFRDENRPYGPAEKEHVD